MWVSLTEPGLALKDSSRPASPTRALAACVGGWVGASRTFSLSSLSHTSASDPAITKACKFLLSKQQADGGSVAQRLARARVCVCVCVCVCAAALSMVLLSLLCPPFVPPSHVAASWGETFESCVTRQYVQHVRSQVVNTAWAVLVLLKVCVR